MTTENKPWWIEKVENCFLGNVESPNGIPEVKVNPDTLLHVVETIMEKVESETRKKTIEEIKNMVHTKNIFFYDI